MLLSFALPLLRQQDQVFVVRQDDLSPSNIMSADPLGKKDPESFIYDEPPAIHHDQAVKPELHNTSWVTCATEEETETDCPSDEELQVGQRVVPSVVSESTDSLNYSGGSCSPQVPNDYRTHPPIGRSIRSPDSLDYVLGSYSPKVHNDYRTHSPTGRSIRSISPGSLNYSLGSDSPPVHNHYRTHPPTARSIGSTSPYSLNYSLESDSPQEHNHYRNHELGGQSMRSSSPDSLAYSLESDPLQHRGYPPTGRSIRSRSQQQQEHDYPAESRPQPVVFLSSSSASDAATAKASNPKPTSTNLMLPSFSTKTVQPFPTLNEMHPWQLSEFHRQGFPAGLALEVGNTKAMYPCRFWVVDNSGSMLKADGHQIRFNAGRSEDRTVVVPCTRWTELQQAVEDHVKLAGVIQVSTVFRMLNDPGVKVAPQEFSVALPASFQEIKEHADEVNAEKNKHRHSLKKMGLKKAERTKRSIAQDVEQAVLAIHKSRPAGATPLTPHLLEFRRRIRSVEEQLRQEGQQAVVVLATDGLPTDKDGEESEDAKDEFAEALKTFQNLPVWIVIRLCTDDKDVVDYYNNLDKLLEIPLEVIGKFHSDAPLLRSCLRREPLMMLHVPTVDQLPDPLKFLPFFLLQTISLARPRKSSFITPGSTTLCRCIGAEKWVITTVSLTCSMSAP